MVSCGLHWQTPMNAQRKQGEHQAWLRTEGKQKATSCPSCLDRKRVLWGMEEALLAFSLS